MGMTFIEPKSGELYDIDTVKGQQAALQYLGFDPGALDGKPGPNTRAAAKKFQAAQKLAADGVIGPNTKTKLLEALQARMLKDAEDMMSKA